MAGKPGTPHFGVPENPQQDGKAVLPDGDQYQKVHFMFDPSQMARAMGSSEGEAPKCGYEPRDRAVDYMCNHDGLTGGDTHIHNMDEQKVLQNRIYSVGITYSSLENDIRSRERSA